MPIIKHNLSHRKKRQLRVRSKMHGTAKKPRISIFRSNKHNYIQAIDDDKQATIASSSDLKIKKTKTKTKSQRAEAVASDMAKKLKKLKIKNLVFDRGCYKYQGRVKIIAQTLRKEGLKV